MPNVVMATDNFIRANQSGWGTASNGSAWSSVGPGTPSINNNSGVLLSAGQDTHLQLVSSLSASDMGVFCQIAINNAGDIAGVETRFLPGGGLTTSYKLLFYGAAVHLNKGVNGANAQFTTVAFTMLTGVFYNFKLLTIGNNLYGKVWLATDPEPGSFTTTFTDSAVPGPGGMAVLANTAGTGVQFKNFCAFSLAENTLVTAMGNSFLVRL